MLHQDNLRRSLTRVTSLLILLALVLGAMPGFLSTPAAFAAGGTFVPAAVTDKTPTAPLTNPTASSFQPRYLSGFGLDNSFTVLFEDRDAGSTISHASTTTGPTGFPASATATSIVDTHFLVKNWPITISTTTYAYRAWGSDGNNLNHNFYVSNDLTNWTQVSTFTISHDAAFTGARGWVYYGFHDVILLNGTYYAFAESNQSQTMIVRSANGDDVWEAFASVGGSQAVDGPLQLPSGVAFGWTPSGSFVDLGHDRGYGKIHVDPRDSDFYLAINLAAKPSLSAAALEAAFIDPANWTWYDGTTGPAANPILSQTTEHDLRECWVVPNTDPDADWVIIYDADFGAPDGGKALGYATLSPPLPPTTKWVDQATGSDGNDGNTEATAYATLQHAINNSASGTSATRSVINVKAGTYETTGQTNTGGFTTAILVKDLDYLTIQAISGHEPKVKPSTAANIVSVSVENSDHLIVDNIDSDQTVAQFDNWHVFDSDDLTVRNSTFEGGEDGIDFNTDITTALIENNTFKNITTGSGDEVLDFTDANPTGVTIQDNVFDYNYRHITLGSGASDFTIQRNLMDGTNSEEAIRLLGPSDILIQNNIIMNNLQQGVYIDSGCSNVTVRHNTFFNNDQEVGGNGEIRTKVVTSDIVIKNNILYGNGSNPGIETSAASLPGEDYNLVYNHSDSFTYGTNTIVGSDPKFVSTTAGSEDLHLQTGSPAIEAGTDLGVTDDFDSPWSRPQPAATNPDMGAYEQKPPSSQVWVDDDYDAAACATDGHVWGYDCFDSIQDGINHVSGSTVYVAAGTYNERITINKSLDLRGAQYGVDPTPSGTRAGSESIITEAGLSTPNPDVLVEIPSGVTNVSVDGFTLLGDQTNPVADTSVLRVWDDDVTISNNIIDGLRGALFKGSDNLTFDQNYATVNKGGVVLQPGASSALTVSDSVFVVGSTPQSDMSGVYATGCTGCSFTGNTVTGFSGRAFGGSNMTTTTISDNTLSGNKDGVSFWGTTTFMTISDNTIDGSTRHGINIKAQDLTISGNEITNSADKAVNVVKHVLDTERVVISANEISGGGSGGIYIGNPVTNLQIIDNWIHDQGGDAVEYASGATVSGVHEVQGNLFQNNSGDGINNNTNPSFDAAYNSWGHYDGPPAPNGDGVTGIGSADYTPWTHVALSMVSSGSPKANEVGVGYTIKYTVKMDAKEVWGADFDLKFDKTKLEVKSLTNLGSFQDAGTCKMGTVAEANTNGEITFCGDRTVIASALSGAGQDVFEVVFEGLVATDPNATPLDLDETDDLFGMAPPGGASNLIYAAELADGEVTVYGSEAVTGRIDLQGRADDTGAVMTFAVGAVKAYGPYTFSTSGYWGAISASGVVHDQYGITATMPRYLDVTGASGKSVTIDGAKTALSTLVLFGGDVNNSGNGDGQIGSSDATIVGSAYGTVPGDTFWDEHADINADSAVSISDLVILGGNYGMLSSSAYASWTP